MPLWFVVTESFISFDMLLKGLEFYRNTNSDCIICIGGEHAIIDFGKLISIFSVNHGSIIDYATAKENFRPRNNLLITLPTTSGSGSEATHFAVLHNGLTKYSIADKSLLPDYVIIDQVNLLLFPPIKRRYLELMLYAKVSNHSGVYSQTQNRECSKSHQSCIEKYRNCCY